MIVVDASAALSALFNDGPARLVLARESLHAPHQIDSEICNGVRRRVFQGDLDAGAGLHLIQTWTRLGVTRYPVLGLLKRVWELRENLSAYDAGYVALAENLGCALITADLRLSRATGIRCPITTVP